MYGSKYDTPFWETAGKLKFEDSRFDSILEHAKKHTLVELQESLGNGTGDSYGQQWEAFNFKNWYDAMTSE